MAVRFNNNSEWMEEMQMLFDKINNGSPFGVIREVFSFSPQLRQFLNNKCHFITLPPLQTPVEIEEHRKNTTFDQNYNSLYYRQSSAQNIKINEIANDLESGKIVGEKIISDALLGVVSCCFMDDKNLKDLKKLLSQDQINLSNAITMTINNSLINKINLTSAIIDKIEYHFRDNTFHFIFNVSNNFLSGKSRLTIEVPRVALENIKLPDMKEIYVNQWYINIFINTLIFSINEGSYTLTGV
ncbi:hypothetical protein K749_02090 [Helicobacter pylori UM299]|uniref:hypothetical protein n=1 Tax=Helicobacter pylori TaxID=210 RepID=UPI00032A22BF|nr:hypothetical protein [Helicobacter pylori]AGL67273.1 hypothetical protein K747_07465 [Helicobacter pylori UM032]AGL67810.1 hypothetical protein K749_02090 [Helicobacter pylori UM299]AGR63199.1 hypothetical protein K748_00565 [Helicobacter pylori UM298]